MWRSAGGCSASCSCAPVLVAMLAGGALGNLVDPLSKHETSSFVLVRPISSLSIVRGKLVMAAIMTAAIWILFLGYISLLLVRPGFIQSIQSVASSVPTWKAIGYPILVAFAARAVYVEDAWSKRSGSASPAGNGWRSTIAFGSSGLVFVSVGIAVMDHFPPGVACSGSGRGSLAHGLVAGNQTRSRRFRGVWTPSLATDHGPAA